MTYFKINNQDFSMYVNKLKVAKNHLFKSMTNAAGNTLIKYVNSKRIIEVGIIPLDAATMVALQNAIKELKITISFLNPETNALDTVNCMLSEQLTEYYTIQDSKVQFKAFALTFTEL